MLPPQRTFGSLVYFLAVVPRHALALSTACAALDEVISLLHAGNQASVFCSSFLHVSPVTSTKTVALTVTTSTVMPDVVTVTVTGGNEGGTDTVTATADTTTVVSTITNTENLCQSSLKKKKRHAPTTTPRSSCGKKPTTTKRASSIVHCEAAPVALKGYECSAVSQACSCLSISTPTSVVSLPTVEATVTSTVTTVVSVTTAVPVTTTVTPPVSTFTSYVTSVVPTCSCSSPGAWALCNKQCVNTETDSTNCGACGFACLPGETCTNGQCNCPGPRMFCNGACVDPTTDSQNCGNCGIVCPSGKCTSSVCACNTQADNGNLNPMPSPEATCGTPGSGCACYQDAYQDVVCAPAVTAETCERCAFDPDCTAHGQGYCVEVDRCIAANGGYLSCIYPGTTCPNPGLPVYHINGDRRRSVEGRGGYV